MNIPERFIDIAIEEARTSLREGNSGFGALIIRDNKIISKAHDTDKTSKDPTAHAELNAIRLAAKKYRGDFDNCMLISTHEPCPMCSTAIVWSGIRQLAYGYSIRESLNQGRKRIDLACKEIFERSGAKIEVLCDIKKEDCAVLYNNQVRESIRQLRNADSTRLNNLAQSLTKKRLDWFAVQDFSRAPGECLDAAYWLFLKKLNISEDDAPIVKRSEDSLVIHSKNFCPTLEACKILDLDTRLICRKLNEGPTQNLLKKLNPNLSFKRNYDKIRPYTPFCEEMIVFDKTQYQATQPRRCS